MRYGELPKIISKVDIECPEMMFYQYLPIKMIGSDILFEPRLNCFKKLIYEANNDFIEQFGWNEFNDSYMYLTTKSRFQVEGCSYNRMGYHSDGFLTDDINYIWSDCNPTVFNNTNFKLTMDDKISMNEMQQQAKVENEVTFENCTLLRLNQFNIHKVAENTKSCMRTFVKISFSKDKYDLVGNAHNYLFDYNWTMQKRKTERNIPQSAKI